MVRFMFNLDDYAERTAIVTDKGQSYSYAELKSAGDRIASCCMAGGLTFCLCRNSYASVAGYVGFLEHHVPAVLLDGAKDSALLENLVRVYSPKRIWTPSERVAELPTGKAVYEMQDYTMLEYEGAGYPIHPDVVLLLTTSGSTGSPKLVKLTERNLRSNAESIAEYLKIDENERPITTLPMYYSFGMSVINSHLIKGATILLTDRTLMQKEFWIFMKEGRATSIAGVPYTYEMLNRLRFFRMDLPYLKTMIQAGGKLNAEIVKEYILDAQAKGREFVVMYGQTEAAPRMSWLPFGHALEKYASIGIAIPGGRLSVRDVNDREITEPDVDGELIYEGPNVCMGYAERPEDLAVGDENHGVLHTGDVARRDKDGYFYITGRMKRFVKVWGNRCNMDATEQLVKPVTTNCACVGVDDKITVFVTEEGLEEKIVGHLAGKMNLHPSAFAVRVIPEIPMKDTGKINYPLLQKMI